MRSVCRVVLAVLALMGAAVLPASADPPLGVDIVTTGFFPAFGQAVMSSNGRYVAWVTYASGTPLFVRDRVAGTTREFTARALHPPEYPYGAGIPLVFAISDDGRYVTYEVGYDGLYAYAIRAWADLETGAVRTLWTSFGPNPTPIVVGQPGVAMSRDGRTIAWAEARQGTSGQVEGLVMAITPADPSRTE